MRRGLLDVALSSRIPLPVGSANGELRNVSGRIQSLRRIESIYMPIDRRDALMRGDDELVVGSFKNKVQATLPTFFPNCHRPA
jgi:hypothetical protein